MQPRGKRITVSSRVPIEHHAVYNQAAEDLGIPLGSLVELRLAELYGLEVPTYIQQELRRAQARREAEESRQELPMLRTA